MIFTLLFFVSATQTQDLEEALKSLKEGSGPLDRTLVNNVGVKYFLVNPTYFTRDRMKTRYLAASIWEKARLLYLARRNDPRETPINFLKRQFHDKRLSDHERYLCYKVYAQSKGYYGNPACGNAACPPPALFLSSYEKTVLDNLLFEDVDYILMSGGLEARAREVYKWITELCRVKKYKLGDNKFGYIKTNDLYVRTIMRGEQRAEKEILGLLETGVLKSEVSWKVVLLAAYSSNDLAYAIRFSRTNIVAACKGGGVVGIAMIFKDFGEEKDHYCPNV